jgi:hypothetical protein
VVIFLANDERAAAIQAAEAKLLKLEEEARTALAKIIEVMQHIEQMQKLLNMLSEDNQTPD